jgi:hypothetical protein
LRISFHSFAIEQIVGRERPQREVIADFQLPIVDLIRAAASTQMLGNAFWQNRER